MANELITLLTQGYSLEMPPKRTLGHCALVQGR
jgi:hypothetical protein